MRPSPRSPLKSFRSLIRRSTLALLVGAIGIFGLLMSWGLGELLRLHVERQLAESAGSLASVLEPPPDGSGSDDGLRLPAPEGRGGASPLVLEALHAVRVLAPDGRPLWRGAQAADGAALPEEALRRVLGGAAVYDRVTAPDGTPARRITVKVPRDGEARYLLQTQTSVLASERTVAGLVLLLLVAGGGTILIGWVLSARLADKLLAPIQQLSARARSISDTEQDAWRLDTAYEEFQELAQAFTDTMARMQRSSESQRQFVDYAAHEMQTPLTVLQTNLEITLHRARTVEEYREALLANLEQVERLMTLARELLALSRLSGKRSPVRLAPLALEPLLHDLIEELTVLAEDREIRLTLEMKPVPPVLGDAQWLKQLLINLLDNAIRYTGPGGAVTVRLRQEGGQVRIDVADTGPGIEPEHLPHLFERFYRTDTARARNSGGTGLGLPIVREIAQAHRGTVGVESEVGKGSTFSLWLPAA